MSDPAPAAARSDRVAIEAINPVDGKVMPVHMTYRRAEWVAKRGQGAVMEMAHLVPAVLARPIAIYEGIRWEGDDSVGDSDGWLCYVGRPGFYFGRDGIRQTPGPENEVFLVFVNKERVVYLWRWEASDQENADLPTKHCERFCRKVLG